MGTEIERKYFLATADWRAEAGPGKAIRQGYFTTDRGVSATVFTNSLIGENSLILKTRTKFGFDVIMLGLSEVSAAKLRKEAGGQDELPLGENFQARTRVAEDQAFLTFKSGKGVKRPEIETEVEVERAEKWLASEHIEGDIIAKTRYRAPLGLRDQVAEVDIFEGANAGLEIVEVELKDEHESVATRAWIGAEVTNEDFGNASLARTPWTKREDKERFARPILGSREAATVYANAFIGPDSQLVNSHFNGFWEIVDNSDNPVYGSSLLLSVHGQIVTIPVAGPIEHEQFRIVLDEALLTGEVITSEKVQYRVAAALAQNASADELGLA